MIKCVLIVISMLMLNTAYAAKNKLPGIEKLVYQADVIAIGKYGDVSTVWEKRKIYTSVKFQPELIIKGSANGEVIIKVLGGTAVHPQLNTPVTMNVSNGVSFLKGNKAMVFLKKNNDAYQIVGMSKGNIPITSDGFGHDYMAGGIKRIDSHSVEGGVVIGSKKMRVDEFTAYIESLVKQKGKQ